jgi:hypothetical protein
VQHAETGSSAPPPAPPGRSKKLKLLGGVPADDVEENFAVLVQFGGAHAMYGTHFGNRRGLSARHVDQRLIGEHHIGRDPLLLGELRAPPPQRFEL